MSVFQNTIVSLTLPSQTAAAQRDLTTVQCSGHGTATVMAKKGPATKKLLEGC